MAITLGDQVRIRQCEWCEKQFEAGDSPREQHCSHDCFYTDRGNGALNQLKSDHRICATCFRYIKTVSTPEQSWLENKADRVRSALDHGGEYHNVDGEMALDATECSNSRHTNADCIIGYQHPTEDTDYLYGNSGKWICSCGCVDTHKRDEILEGLDLDETVSLLLSRLQDQYDKGAIPEAPTDHRFFEAFTPDDRNWEYAVGKALYADR